MLRLHFGSSDLQLAIALQQQEIEQQQQQQQPPPPRNLQQPTVSGGSRLVTGPQVGFLKVFHFAYLNWCHQLWYNLLHLVELF